jgi:hypothetical protein
MHTLVQTAIRKFDIEVLCKKNSKTWTVAKNLNSHWAITISFKRNKKRTYETVCSPDGNLSCCGWPMFYQSCHNTVLTSITVKAVGTDVNWSCTLLPLTADSTQDTLNFEGTSFPPKGPHLRGVGRISGLLRNLKLTPQEGLAPDKGGYNLLSVSISDRTRFGYNPKPGAFSVKALLPNLVLSEIETETELCPLSSERAPLTAATLNFGPTCDL